MDSLSLVCLYIFLRVRVRVRVRVILHITSRHNITVAYERFWPSYSECCFVDSEEMVGTMVLQVIVANWKRMMKVPTQHFIALLLIC